MKRLVEGLIDFYYEHDDVIMGLIPHIGIIAVALIAFMIDLVAVGVMGLCLEFGNIMYWITCEIIKRF